tara:strand:- start:2104 stop:2352 length:249 start_codon:yes stop_codon:yes gene_type:complete
MRTTLHFFFLEGISAGELMFVFFIVLLFFGSKSIPKMARTFGRAMRQIRDASQQIQDDIRNAAEDQPTNQQVVEKEVSKNND